MRARQPQANPVTVLTPIVPGERDALESHLVGLGTAPGGSPLARVPGTHFARWVIVPDFATEPKQPAADQRRGARTLPAAPRDRHRAGGDGPSCSGPP